MKLEIDSDRCQGHAICYLLAPKFFDADDDGRGRVLDQEVSSEAESQARLVEGRCPEQAIRMKVS